MFQFLPRHLWPEDNTPEVEPNLGSPFIPTTVRPLRKFARSLGVKRPYLQKKDQLTQTCMDLLNHGN